MLPSMRRPVHVWYEGHDDGHNDGQNSLTATMTATTTARRLNGPSKCLAYPYVRIYVYIYRSAHTRVHAHGYSIMINICTRAYVYITNDLKPRLPPFPLRPRPHGRVCRNVPVSTGTQCSRRSRICIGMSIRIKS